MKNFLKLFERTIILEKIRESLKAVLPITALILVVLLTVVPTTPSLFLVFLIGATLLTVGMGLFTLGAETAMTPMGSYVGTKMTKTKKLWLILLCSLFVGTVITVSEPDLAVLAGQISSLPNVTLIVCVGLGVGIFLALAMMRILLRVPLKYLLVGSYALIFILAFFIPPDYLPLSFDSGGVTTGPMTVPFIMALGVGVSSVRSDESADNDSFGLLALCSVGPILAVMILSLFTKEPAVAETVYEMPAADIPSSDLVLLFLKEVPATCKDVALSVAPIAVFFFLFYLIFRGMERSGILKILVGIAYTYVGLVLFLTGVNTGFVPVGNHIGMTLGEGSAPWIAVPLGMLLGYFMISAEPAMCVLKAQVQDATSGVIPGKLLSRSLGIAVALSVGLAMTRVLTGVPILWILVPGYGISLLLCFFVPDIFTSIAFDSGGVASGAMTAAFLIPLAVGLCSSLGGNVVEDAFGVVAMVAMTPLITIQTLGLVFRVKQAKANASVSSIAEEDDIIDL